MAVTRPGTRNRYRDNHFHAQCIFLFSTNHFHATEPALTRSDQQCAAHAFTICRICGVFVVTLIWIVRNYLLLLIYTDHFKIVVGLCPNWWTLFLLSCRVLFCLYIRWRTALTCTVTASLWWVWFSHHYYCNPSTSYRAGAAAQYAIHISHCSNILWPWVLYQLPFQSHSMLL